MNTSLQIYASGDHYHSVDELLPDLKELTQQVTGKSFRRIGRFIQLAMIGAARCTQLSAPKDTAVYLASGRGDLELTVDIMRDLFAHAQTPKPLAFVNTVSNAACFYVAQLLSLQSRSNYVCNRYFAFENALQLAMMDLRINTVASVLVGSVDLCTHPIVEHRQRLHLAPQTVMGEGSHWLWIGRQNTQRPKLGELLDVQHFVDHAALSAWIQSQTLSKVALSRGQFVNDDEWTSITATVQHDAIFDYRTNRGYYDCHSGAVIGAFLRSDCPASTLMHINTDDSRRYCVMLVTR